MLYKLLLSQLGGTKSVGLSAIIAVTIYNFTDLLHCAPADRSSDSMLAWFLSEVFFACCFVHHGLTDDFLLLPTFIGVHLRNLQVSQHVSAESSFLLYRSLKIFLYILTVMIH